MSSTPINLREGGAELLGEVALLWEQLQRHHAQFDERWAAEVPSGPFSLWREELEAKTAMRVYLGEDQGKSIAYCVCSVTSNALGEIDSIFVLDSYREMELGDLLMQRALAWLQSQRATDVVVTVLPANSRAVQFYKKYGFQPCSVRMIYNGQHPRAQGTVGWHYRTEETADDIVYSVDPGLLPSDFVDILKRSTLAERRPVADEAVVEGMLKHADLIVTARTSEGKLVGVARSITDFHYCTYLSDLAVDAEFQRRGIGRALIEFTHKAAGVDTILILLAAPAATSYYPQIGMTQHDSCWIKMAAESRG